MSTIVSDHHFVNVNECSGRRLRYDFPLSDECVGWRKGALAPCPPFFLLRLNWWTRFASIRQLKPLEAIKLLLDPALQILARLAFRGLAPADPGPLLHQELPVLPVGLEIERGDDVAADQNRQREIAELAFLLRHISLEAVLVVEEQMRPLAQDDQQIERRQDVHERTFASGLARRILERRLILQRFGRHPMLRLASAFERDRQQLL